MKLLLIESAPGIASELGATLEAEGHQVVHCTDEGGGPCRGVGQPDSCPLEQHVDLAVLARRPDSPHTLDEMGSVCAARHRVPSIVVDPAQLDDELPNVTVANAVATRAAEAAYEAAVRNELAHLPALVDVRRTTNRIHVYVQIPASQNDTVGSAAAADRARIAVRSHDPFVQGIDVSVSYYPD